MKTLIQKVFREAAKELGVKIQAPFRLNLSKQEIEFDVHVLDFGGPKGILVISFLDPDFSSKAKFAHEAGFSCSGLNPECYTVFNRQEFIDKFDDWKWCGKGKSPEWYTGKNWCESDRKNS